MVSKFYNKNIAEGKSFLVFAIILSVLIRGVYLIHPSVTIPVAEGAGYLWKPLVPLFKNPIYSVLASSLCVLIISFFVGYINTQHTLIRIRTLLPVGIALLLFSCMPQQLAMSSFYIGTIAILFVVNSLFRASSSGSKQENVFRASLYLALGSLFEPVLLIYFPVLWVCFIRMRSFNFQSFLASLFSFFILYALVFSYFFIVEENTEGFFEPYMWLSSVDWLALPVLSYSLYNYIILGVVALLVLVGLIDNSINSFQDKIRIRVLLSVLSIISFFSLACVLLLNINSYLPLYGALAVSSLQFGHFFALAQQKLIPYLFYVMIIVLIAISFLFI